MIHQERSVYHGLHVDFGGVFWNSVLWLVVGEDGVVVVDFAITSSSTLSSSEDENVEEVFPTMLVTPNFLEASSPNEEDNDR